MTKVLSAMPRSSSALSTVPTFLSWSIMASWYGLCQRPDWPMLSGLVWVRKCMWVKFTQTKNGLPAFVLPLDEVHGPVGDVVVDRLHPLLGQRAGVLDICLPTLPKRGSTVGSSLSEALQSSTPRGPNFARNAGSFG